MKTTDRTTEPPKKPVQSFIRRPTMILASDLLQRWFPKRMGLKRIVPKY